MANDLLAFRTRLGISQSEIARQTGITQATISRIEAKRQKPSGSVLRTLDAWAAAIAKRKRIPAAERLGWDWLDPVPPSRAPRSRRGVRGKAAA